MNAKSRTHGKPKTLLAAAGSRLRKLRETRALTMRQVHAESQRIARTAGHRLFEIVPSRLHLIERGRHIPNLYRLYTLACVYQSGIRQLLGFYGLTLSTKLRPARRKKH